jgi:hypothetical protein
MLPPPPRVRLPLTGLTSCDPLLNEKLAIFNDWELLELFSILPSKKSMELPEIVKELAPLLK